MIRGVHTMFYSSEPEAFRAFLRDKLQFSYSDVGDGWLIFDLPEADMGCHPAGQGADAGTHNISFYCDDVRESQAALQARGVEFVDEISDHGYGLVTHFRMPGGVEAQLYQPLYEKRAKPKKRVAVKKKKKAVKKSSPRKAKAKAGKRRK